MKKTEVRTFIRESLESIRAIQTQIDNQIVTIMKADDTVYDLEQKLTQLLDRMGTISHLIPREKRREKAK